MKSKAIRQAGYALLVSVAATGLRYAAHPFGIRTFLFHIFAVAVAAQYFGTVAGLMTTGLSILQLDYFFIPPAYALRISNSADVIALVLFAAVGIAFSLFGGWRKRVEVKLQETAKALQHANERLTLEHEIARVGSVEWFVPEDRIEYSSELQTMYKLKHNVHTFAQWKELVHPDDLTETLALIDESIKQRQPTLDMTYRIRRSDGVVMWIHSRRKFEYDTSGHSIHVLAVNMDISDLKQGEMAQQILGGLLQVCSACRRIRDPESNEWYSMEGYLRNHTTAKFSHGMCTDCGKQWYGER